MVDVEVVRDGEPVEVGMLAEELCGVRVGGVEGEIANAEQVFVVAVAVLFEGGEVAEEESVGLGAFEEGEVSGFAGFEDARCGEEDFLVGGGGGAETIDGFAAAAWVFEVAVDDGDA